MTESADSHVFLFFCPADRAVAPAAGSAGTWPGAGHRHAGDDRARCDRCGAGRGLFARAVPRNPCGPGRPCRRRRAGGGAGAPGSRRWLQRGAAAVVDTLPARRPGRAAQCGGPVAAAGRRTAVVAAAGARPPRPVDRHARGCFQPGAGCRDRRNIGGVRAMGSGRIAQGAVGSRGKRRVCPDADDRGPCGGQCRRNPALRRFGALRSAGGQCAGPSGLDHRPAAPARRRGRGPVADGVGP